MQQHSLVLATKHFAKSIKFWLFKQNVLLVQQNALLLQQKKFRCIEFVLSVRLKNGPYYQKQCLKTLKTHMSVKFE